MSEKLQLTLAQMKALTTDQYDAARSKAIERVRTRIGERPTREQFQREMGALATPLDWLALVVFVAALAISSVHIISFMTLQAVASYHMDADAPGLVISPHAWAVVHQVGAILLAEAAALLFMTQHSLSASERAKLPAWRRWFSMPLLLAAMAAVFVFAANLSSGVDLLVSVLPPVMTLGIAVRLEAIIAESLKRRDEVNIKYIQAMETYEKSKADQAAHPDYKKLLKQEIWAALVKLPSNKAFVDAPPSLKHAAVARELARDTWAEADHVEASDQELEAFAPPPPPVKPVKKAKPVGDLPFGHTAHEIAQAVPENMLMTAPANGHGPEETEQE